MQATDRRQGAKGALLLACFLIYLYGSESIYQFAKALVMWTLIPLLLHCIWYLHILTQFRQQQLRQEPIVPVLNKAT
jgi:hypothetical protein